MRVAAGFLATLALMGCQNSARTAEAKYRNLAAAGASKSDLCDQALAVKKAYGEAGDKAAYSDWSMTAYNDCTAAKRAVDLPSL